MEAKQCCFIGHRTIVVSDELKSRIYEYVEDLIINHNVKRFLFGSRSEFNRLCHEAVDKLKKKYPNIERVFYTCRHESAILERDKDNMRRAFSIVCGRDTEFVCFDAEYAHKTKFTSGRATYIERNRAMIDDSDFCVFYYDENYRPNKRKRFKSDLTYYQPDSGTRLAYLYAKRKCKNIENFYGRN